MNGSNLAGDGHKADYAVDLEPPFYPFFGHFISEDIIDDGKRETWFSSIFNPPGPPQESPYKKEPVQAYAHSTHSNDDPLTVFVILLPRQFRQSTDRIEQVLIMLSYRKSPISFEIIASEEAITLQMVCREPDAVFVQTQLRAFFPDCTIMESSGDKVLEVFLTELPLYTVDFGLQEEFMRPLATYPNLDHEPLTALFGILTRLQEDEYVIIQILFSGTHNAWAESIMTSVLDDSGKQSFFFDAPEMPQLAKEKVARPLYGVAIRAIAVAYTVHEAAILLQHVSTAVVHASTGTSNALIPLSTPEYIIEERMVDILLRGSHRVGMVLNSKELATFVHFPSIHSKKLLQSNQTTKAAPNSLIGHDYVLGINEHQELKLT